LKLVKINEGYLPPKHKFPVTKRKQFAFLHWSLRALRIGLGITGSVSNCKSLDPGQTGMQ
jgi:hypothetical protein